MGKFDVAYPGVIPRILAIRSSIKDRHLLIGIDGVDGSGKTTFTEKLMEALSLEIAGEYLQVISIDNFHNTREIRYQQGKTSPIGFFEDSFDYGSLKERVLDPIKNSHGKSVSIIPGSHDLSTDERITPMLVSVEPLSIVIVEGIFLHRDELRGYFDISVFLDLPFHQSVTRMAQRDGSIPDPNHPSVRRYVEGQKIYFKRCAPKVRATLLLDNSD
ncbi:MAG: uridine kinase [Actinobacteria bacterium]|nr:uridine kinase [Actinomycetota bacterium]